MSKLPFLLKAKIARRGCFPQNIGKQVKLYQKALRKSPEPSMDLGRSCKAAKPEAIPKEQTLLGSDCAWIRSRTDVKIDACLKRVKYDSQLPFNLSPNPENSDF